VAEHKIEAKKKMRLERKKKKKKKKKDEAAEGEDSAGTGVSSWAVFSYVLCYGLYRTVGECCIFCRQLPMKSQPGFK